jgi:hypothetical protein
LRTERTGGIILYKTKRTEGIAQDHEDRLDYTGPRGEIGLQRIMWTHCKTCIGLMII